MSRIGFCCIWKSPDGDEAAQSLVNQESTTVTRLSKMTRGDVEALLVQKVGRNMGSLEQLIRLVGSFPDERKMVRLGSDLLPCFTHEVAAWVYKTPSMQALIETGLSRVGALARSHDVRLSFHPDHHCRLNTENPGHLSKALETFEMHVMMAEMMGYGHGFHPHGFAINIHLGGKEGGVHGFRRGFELLSDAGKNLITIENDEFSFGLTDLEGIADLCPIVTDIFHEWVYSKGSYLQANDNRITDYIIPSWRGVRPLGHFSQPRRELMLQHSLQILPSYINLKAAGVSAQHIRGHSDYLWNEAANDWALTHLTWMDIEVEAKMQNLASEQLYDRSMGR